MCYAFGRSPGRLVAAGPDIANGNITKMFPFAKHDMFVPNCAVANCIMSTKEHKSLWPVNVKTS